MKQWVHDRMRGIRRAFGAWLALASVLLVSMATASPARALTIVRFEPAAPTVNVGHYVSVDIVADFSDPIVAFGLDVGVSPTLLYVSSGSAVVGPLWIGVLAPDGDGLAGLTATSGITGTGVLLATVTLRAGSTAGEAQILGSITPGDLTEGFGLAGGGFDSVQFEPASISVVPEASTTCLLSLGLLLVSGVRRRRHRGRHC